VREVRVVVWDGGLERFEKEKAGKLMAWRRMARAQVDFKTLTFSFFQSGYHSDRL
jgi:hypothetical protein